MKNQKSNRNWIFWLAIFCVFAYLTYILRSVLLPFVAGMVIGYLLDPWTSKLEKFGLSRTLATIVVLTMVIIFAVPTLFLILGMIQEELLRFLENAPQYIADITEKMEPALIRMQDRFPEFRPSQIKDYMADNMSDGVKIAGKIVKGVLENSFALINLLSLMLITPIVAFYMLRDWKCFIKKADSLLPRRAKKSIRQQAKEIDRAMAGFIRGQLCVCLLLGTYYSLGLYFVGLEMGIWVGFLAGLISFIPYVGSISGFVVATLLALVQFNSWGGVVGVMAVFLSGQFIEGNFLTPKFVGDSVGLHPVWIMFALLSGGVLLGFLGLMIAIPVAAIIAVLLRHAVERYKKSSIYLED